MQSVARAASGSRNWHGRAWGAAGAVLLLSSLAFSDPGLEAFAARQDRVRTAELVMKVQQLFPAGSVSAEAPVPIKGGPLPERDTETEFVTRILVDGPKVLFESDQPIWGADTRALTRKSNLGAYNGTVNKLYAPQGIGPDNTPHGVIVPGGAVSHVRDILYLPVMLHLFGRRADLAAYTIDQFQQTGARLTVGGKRCEEYRVTLSVTSALVLWLDPECGYSARRIQHLELGRVCAQHDIELGKNTTVGWLPTSWATQRYDKKSKLLSRGHVELTQIALGDPIPSERFNIAFAPGTHVIEKATSKRYIVTTSGDLQEVGRDGQPVGTPVAPPDASWLRRNRWVLLGVVCSIALLGVAHPFLRRLRRSAAQGP